VNSVTPSGVPGLGEVPWGSHFCHFYESRDDLADTLVPFFKSGLERNEVCLWVTSEPFRAAEARGALGTVVGDLEEREAAGQIEIIDHDEWYLRHGKTDARRTLDGWIRRERAALDAGYSGLRLTGNTYWLHRQDWDSFVQYEALVNESFRSFRIVALCSYCFGRCQARDVLDVVKNHQFTIARRDGVFEVLESAALKLAREDLLRVQEVSQALREHDRRKDEFLAMVSHELRNPLAPIATAADVIRIRDTSGAYEKQLGVIDRQVKHLSGLVDDLLDVSRVARGAIEIQRQRVDLAEVAARAIEMTKPLIDRNAHELHVDALPGVAVKGDLARLSQVIGNLLSNAAKYSPPMSRIDLVVRPSEAGATLVVRDTGPGIAEELLPRLFDLFVQGERASDRAQGGLGIGLSVVKSLVELHEGKITVRNRQPRGAEFEITLPRWEADLSEPQDAERPEAMALPKERARVLVVDDNRDAAELLAEALELLGFETRVAGDGAAALALAAEFRPRAAVVDIGLPVMDGHELARRLRGLLGEGVALMAVTGYGREADRAASWESGFSEHFVKPVALDVLASQLSRALREPSQPAS
jgi:signal transduction histidine kinase/CheY-like chemotaxis protein